MKRLVMASWMAAIGMLGLVETSRAAVRVEADEVIFSLSAHDAQVGYLVGDFNQWNPTVEPMNREGDAFVVRLFLVAGTYRYKFVVDGKPIADPDNRGSSPEQGSPIVLVERSGGLILSTEIVDESAPARTASYGARYIGMLRVDDGDSDVEQRVDAGVHARLDRLRARAIVATHDSTWTWSPPSFDAFLDRGIVDVDLGKFVVRGFENDSTWASSDLLQLVGNAGIYGYDGGFLYRGVTAVAESKHVSLRARWSDETQRRTLPRATIDPATLATFSNGNDTDTTAYAYTPSFDGSDMVAVELTAGDGDFQSGYGFRNDTGMNPGVWADIQRDSSAITAPVYATREDRHVSTAWASWSGVHRALITFAYGWGDADARAYAAAPRDTVDASSPLDAATASESVDLSRAILGTDRFVVELELDRRLDASLQWDLTRFDFDGVEGTSKADVHRVRLEGDIDAYGWNFAGGATYTAQDYGATPDALYIDWPERNVWLSRWDDMDIPSIVALDIVRHTVWTATATRDGDRVDAGIEALVQTPEVSRAPVYGSARAHADVAVRGPWYVYGDLRFSWYDRDAWNVDESFFDGYIEAGYRKGAISLNAGFGLDPWAFDSVVNEFADNGRTEFLRGAIANGVRRSAAHAIGAALVERERALSDLQLFKLECVIDLR